jgi:hypothetical protein
MENKTEAMIQAELEQAAKAKAAKAKDEARRRAIRHALGDQYFPGSWGY